MYSFFYINFGFLKGAKVLFLKSKNLRPTKNNVRELLLSWIFSDIKKIYMLDLFSGSGIVGFELLSIGTSKIIMLENNYDIYNVLLRNKLNLYKHSYNFHLLLINSYTWLKKFNFLNVSFVLFDAPYNYRFIGLYFILLCKIIFLRKCLFICIESGSDDILYKIPYDWFLIKREILGNTYIYFFKKI